MKKILWQLAQAGLAAVDGQKLVSAQNLSAKRAVIAIGKASLAMMHGAEIRLGSRLSAGLIIAKRGQPRYSGQAPVQCLYAAHPVPDASSLQAGRALIDFIQQQNEPLLFLISGGASSLVECLPAGMDLSLWQRLNQWLLGSGLAIEQINAVRRAYSLIKGGGLIQYLPHHQVEVWLLSDVLSNDLASIGSGLLYPDPVVELPALPDELPPPPTSKQRPDWQPEHRILADLHTALKAIRQQAQSLGLSCYDYSIMDGDVLQEAQAFAQYLKTAPAGLHISGGEMTVKLPANPGQGGRLQQFALAMAAHLSGQPISLLALATDGDDGPTPYAGAYIDSSSAQHLPDIQQILARADALPALQRIQALIKTGYTGSNVNDLVLAFKS